MDAMGSENDHADLYAVLIVLGILKITAFIVLISCVIARVM
jgi:hypothetical protein